MILVVMGVCGCGKTTVGRALAEALHWPFIEADDFHSPANIAKMRSGTPLQDADRWPWLDAMQAELARRAAACESAVLACSALRAVYRQRLAGALTEIHFVHLQGRRELLAQRLAARSGHYMPATLLDSQLAILEPPTDAIALDIAQPVAELVDELRRRLFAITELQS